MPSVDPVHFPHKVLRACHVLTMDGKGYMDAMLRALR